MNETLVELSAVEHRFGSQKALCGVDLRLGSGEIVGLAGPNGSGKTTLLKIVAGLLSPAGGRVRVLGRDPWRERAAVMRAARFAFAPPALYESLTGREHLSLLAALGRSSTDRPLAGEVPAALAAVGLENRADDRVRTYSFGMRQRLGLAQALVPMPRLLVLDEPTDGLDPLAVLELRGVLGRLRRDAGVGVLLSSHLLIELDELVDDLLVLHEGRALFAGPPAELCRGAERLRLAVADGERAAALLRARGIEVERGGDGTLTLAPGALSLAEAHELLQNGGVELREYRLERPSLEQAVLARLRGESQAAAAATEVTA